ncbi:ATP-binding protein [Kitasatospora sp. NPDC004240]
MITTDRAAPVIAAGGGPGIRAGSAACAMRAAPASVPALRHFARAAARRWRLPQCVDEALELIVTELVTNVVRHSGSPDVAVLLATDGVEVVVEVRDHGRWRNRRSKADSEACCGRGLKLVEAYSDSCTMRATPAGTRVTAELLLPDPAAPAPEAAPAPAVALAPAAALVP